MAITARQARTFDPRQPFSRAEARSAGLGPRTLLSSRFHKVFYDCYVSSSVQLTTRLRAKAVLSSPEQTFLDLAAGLDLVALVVPGDSLLKAARTNAAALRDAALVWRGREPERLAGCAAKRPRYGWSGGPFNACAAKRPPV